MFHIQLRLAAFLLVFGVPASASAFCFELAAQEYGEYGVTSDLLYAIAKTESNLNPRATNVNAGGSEDVGLMQINSSWFPMLGQRGITRSKLFEPCLNVRVGAWILASNMHQHGRTWRAVGAYNARSPEKQKRYIEKIAKNFQ